jgi:hypothetical protein
VHWWVTELVMIEGWLSDEEFFFGNVENWGTPCPFFYRFKELRKFLRGWKR